MNKKLQQFKEGKLALHTPTQELYDKLMRWCEKQGITSPSCKATEWDVWKNNKEQTSIIYTNTLYFSKVYLRYTCKSFYEREGYTIATLTDDDFKENNMFTKDDLKTGMVVELRNGRRYMVLQDVKTAIFDSQGVLLIQNNDAINGETINNDLTNTSNNIWDIMKIYRPLVGTLEYTREHCNTFNLIWQRESTEKQALRKNIEKLEQELAETKKNLEAIG